jgi:hypothetical protein
MAFYDSIVDLLQGVGTVLDTPRRMAWAVPGWLGGGTDPITAALNPSEAVSGEDVTGDPYTGTALELLGDPLNLLGGFGLIKKLGKARKAKAFNKTAARLLETGGMPEDVARLTKAVDETGEPLRLGHGTGAVFDKFDLAKAQVDSRWGKGLAWGTPGLGVASEYADASKAQQVVISDLGKAKAHMVAGGVHPDHAEGSARAYARVLSSNAQRGFPPFDTPPGFAMPSPHVKTYFLDSRKPFDVRARYPVPEAQRIAPGINVTNTTEHESILRKLAQGEFTTEEANQLLNRVGKSLPPRLEIPGRDILEQLGPQNIMDRLTAAGYDALKTKGGQGGWTNPHDVWIAYNQNQIYSPWIAPNKQPVPKLSPTIAALLGYNTGRAYRPNEVAE